MKRTVYNEEFYAYLKKVLKEKGWEAFKEANKKRLQDARKRGIKI